MGLTFGIIAGVIILVLAGLSHLGTQLDKAEKNKPAPDYRSDERLFMQALRTRNPERRTRGGVEGHFSGCIICGDYLEDEKFRRRPLCKECELQVQHILHKEQHSGKVPNYSDDSDDQQLILATETRITHCLIIAYDLDDHAITEQCAKDDTAAAKRFEKEKYQRIERDRALRATQEQQRAQKQKADRKAASETLKRLSK